ncbi:MAG: aldehyde dehydrogenase [Anaerorhabdus sp.]
MITLNKSKEIVKKQRIFYNSNKTKSYDFRKFQLKKLAKAIDKYENKILDALKKDLNKSNFEAHMTEIGIVKEELRFTLKNLKHWCKAKRVRTPIMHFLSSSYIHQGPYGITLVMSPWNYPFQLTMIPLIGSIAAGNCVILKPSEYSFNTSEIIEKIILEVFDENYVYLARGSREKNQELLDENYDYIFFTGGYTVGKLVMEKAAKHLTPITLELGGKSPCIVDSSADIKLAAKRIVWGKFINAGQTCVAPDYVLVETAIKDKLIIEMKKWIVKFYGLDQLRNDEYPKIINQKHLDRLSDLVNKSDIIFGGEKDIELSKISPTLIDAKFESVIMNEEIFGPLLPIISVDDFDVALNYIKSKPHPLALYLFSTNKSNEQRYYKELSFGCGCVNDVIIQLSNSHLGFGGVGDSGMGSYHGKKTFDTFSHYKSIMKKSNIVDIPLRYAPFKNHLKFLKIFMK